MEFAVSLLLLLSGVWITVRLRGVQLRRFTASLAAPFLAEKHTRDGVSPFAAMSTSLAATLGTGNVAGVCGSILLGGPGTIFWMWVGAFFGMAVKYIEIFLALSYRSARRPLSIGPMGYIDNALPKKWHFLSRLYAGCAMLAAIGMGNFVQAGTIAESTEQLLLSISPVLPPHWRFYLGVGMALLSGCVVLGGARRIGGAASLLVPLMSVLYIGGCGAILIRNATRILPAITSIFSSAFSFAAPSALGGTIGFLTVFRIGITRGVFTHEAGLGTAALAHALSNERSAEKQALFGIFEVFLDTIVLCTFTAITVLASGIALPYGDRSKNAAIASEAFCSVFPPVLANGFLAVMLLLFAFSSILSFCLYGSQCATYLFGKRATRPYQIIFLVCIVLGCTLQLSLIWKLSEVFNALLALPNLLALFLILRRQTLKNAA